jgi:hypothetical protein
VTLAVRADSNRCAFRVRLCLTAKLPFAGVRTGKLKINYVKRLARGVEELAPDVVELWIGVFRQEGGCQHRSARLHPHRAGHARYQRQD